MLPSVADPSVSVSSLHKMDCSNEQQRPIQLRSGFKATSIKLPRTRLLCRPIQSQSCYCNYIRAAWLISHKRLVMLVWATNSKKLGLRLDEAFYRL